MNIHELLHQYWGFETFRPLQEDIINSVLEGKDTLALMPTSGGKSICYQLPALSKPGICIVISPLIALMKDQAEALQAKGIRVLSVYSGISARESDIAFDNAAYGNYKFLFLSPERLENELFRERLINMPVNLIAVDEAHCVSQWGYDFRPAYLKIAEIREIIPNVPIIALTATATPEVKKEIIEKLLFKKGYASHEMSFERKNLIYAVLHEEDKRNRILKLLKDIPGSSIIYVRNRRLTTEMSQFLNRNKISADHYHGGLGAAERSLKQEKWKNNTCRVMVATNAFGMGIDKADVRSVIHYDLPESLEAYYQEAGRSGRDGQRAFPMLFAAEGDKSDLQKRTLDSFPDINEIKSTYHALGNFFQLPEGSGKGESFDFNIGEFTQRYDFTAAKVYASLQFLEQAGYVSISEAVYIPSRFMVKVNNSDLYRYQVENPHCEPLIKHLLRSYGGCFENYVKIDEKQIADKLNMSIREVIKMMVHLRKAERIDYLQRKDAPQLTFIEERVSKDHLMVNEKYILNRKKVHEQKINGILEYAFAAGKCRGNILLNYFGEETKEDCGHCDYCLKYKDSGSTESIRTKIQRETLTLLSVSGLKMEILLETIGIGDKKEVLETLRWMADNNIITISAEGTVIKR